LIVGLKISSLPMWHTTQKSSELCTLSGDSAHRYQFVAFLLHSGGEMGFLCFLGWWISYFGCILWNYHVTGLPTSYV